MTERATGIGTNQLLAALSPADRARLNPHLLNYAMTQGKVLQEQGQRIDHVYFPKTGMISLLGVMSNGDAIETATVGHEGMIGAPSGRGPRPAPSRAVVQVSGAALRITAAKFQGAVEVSDALRDLVTRYKETLFAQAQQTAACNALHMVEPRLCRWLLHTLDRTDGDIVPLTQEFLSQMLGVRRTTVTEAASALQATGVIQYRRGTITVVDRARLDRMACECYAAIRRHTDSVVVRRKR